MSCDNIQGNGHVAHAMITAYARRRDPELAEWIEAQVPFPNSMVDRITPRTTDEDRQELTELKRGGGSVKCAVAELRP